MLGDVAWAINSAIAVSERVTTRPNVPEGRRNLN